MTNGDERDQGEKRSAEILAVMDNNPAKRARIEPQGSMQAEQEQHEGMDHVTAEDASAKEIKMLLQMEAAKKTRAAKPSPSSGKQSMRCQVCIRAKKGGCGTERAVYRCLRRPGGPRAASLLICPVVPSKEGKMDGQVARRKTPKKDGDDGTWLDLNARVLAKFQDQWHPGTIRRVHKHKRNPYGVKCDADKDNTYLLWVAKTAIAREEEPVGEGAVEGEQMGYKEDESLSAVEEPMQGKRLPTALSATPPLLGITPAEMMQQMHPSMASKFHAVVRDAATGGVKLCRKCNQPALPGNYGFCAMHRTPRSRGSGKHDGGVGGLVGGPQGGLRSVAMPPTITFPGGMPTILQRALQAQAIGGAVTTGTASSAGSPFAVSSMASMGSIAPPLLPNFFPSQGSEPTAVATTAPAVTAPTQAQGLAAGMMMMPNMVRNPAQDIPIVYGSVDSFLPNNFPGGTATAVVADADAEGMPSHEGGDIKVVSAVPKPVEIPQIPQATVANDVVSEPSAEKANNGLANIYADLFTATGAAPKPPNA